MNSFSWFIITLLAAAIGMFIATKLKIPCAGIIGAMVGVIALNIASNGSAVFYKQMKVAVQLTVGAMSGAKVGRNEIKGLKTILIPLLVMLPLILVYNVLFGFIIYKLSSLDAITSFFCVTPGGLTDIAAVAEELGANTSYIAVIHVVRILMCNALLPAVFLRIIRHDKGSTPAKRINDSAVDNTKMVEPSKNSAFRIIALFVFSSIGGLGARLIGIKGGAIIGSMLFSIVFSCAFGKTAIPKAVRKVQQISTGAYVGSGIVLNTILDISILILPMLLSAVNVLLSTFLTSWLIYKTGKLDRLSSMTCSAPGGAPEMILVTDELHGDVTRVGLIHSIRVIYVVSVFPTLIGYFANAL